jgi:hypothetical protein
MREKVPLVQIGRLVLGVRSDGGSFFLVEQEVGLLVFEFFVSHREGESVVVVVIGGVTAVTTSYY